MLVYDKHGNQIELLENDKFYTYRELTLDDGVSGYVREISLGNLMVVHGFVTFAKEWPQWTRIAYNGISIPENVNFKDLRNKLTYQYHSSGSIQSAEVFPAGTSLAFTFLYIIA